MLRRCFRLVFVLLFSFVVIANLRLYGGTNAQDAIAQLRFLREALDRGAATEMQGRFPEGYFFMYALYGVAWVDIGRGEAPGSARRIEARAEAKWALEQLESPLGQVTFPKGAEPPYGIFYAGWINWLRGGMLALDAEAERSPEEWRLFADQSARISGAFAKSETPFLQAYAGEAWPVDSVVAAASLRLHDHLAPARFEGTLARWREQVRTRLDPATGLVPHRVDPATGRLLVGARGSSQALLLRFLLEIDPEMGRADYSAFRKQFVAPGWIAPGTREYPIEMAGESDVDSGPLIDGVSLSASVVSIATGRIMGDNDLVEPYLQLGEGLGMPVAWGGSRRYLLGQLPIADAFLVYARTATSWTDAPAAVTAKRIVPSGWRLGWHVLTLGPFAIAIGLARRRRLAATAP